METIHKEVKRILAKQCEIVGVKYEDIDFTDDLWFFQRQWTKEQEAEFIDWMTEHLRTNKDVRGVIMNIPSRGRDMCKRTAEAFAFNFGWKYKE